MEHDVVCIADEVYEGCVYSGPHRRVVDAVQTVRRLVEAATTPCCVFLIAHPTPQVRQTFEMLLAAAIPGFLLDNSGEHSYTVCGRLRGEGFRFHDCAEAGAADDGPEITREFPLGRCVSEFGRGWVVALDTPGGPLALMATEGLVRRRRPRAGREPSTETILTWSDLLAWDCLHGATETCAAGVSDFAPYLDHAAVMVGAWSREDGGRPLAIALSDASPANTALVVRWRGAAEVGILYPAKPPPWGAPPRGDCTSWPGPPDSLGDVTLPAGYGAIGGLVRVRADAPEPPVAHTLSMAQYYRALCNWDADWTCVVCMDAAAEIRFDPCGHTVCCPPCARQVDHCPICRAVPISRTAAR